MRHDLVDAAGRPHVGRRPGPRRPGVVRSIETGAAAARFHRRVEPARVRRRDGQLRVDDALGQTLRHRRPGLAAVRRLEQAAVGPVPGAVLPRPLPLFPQGRVDDVRVRGIDVDVLAAGVLVLEQHPIESLAAVERAEDAAFLVRPVGMAERGDEDPIGILRIDRQLRNLLRVTQPEMDPGLAGVARTVDAVADRQVRPRQAFAAGDVDDVRVGRRDGDPADRAGRLILEDRLPGPAGVGGLPHAAVDHPDVEGVRLAGVPGRGLGAAGAIRADVPPLHVGEQRGIDLRVEGRGLRGKVDAERNDAGERDAAGTENTTERHQERLRKKMRARRAEQPLREDATSSQWPTPDLKVGPTAGNRDQRSTTSASCRPDLQVGRVRIQRRTANSGRRNRSSRLGLRIVAHHREVGVVESRARRCSRPACSDPSSAPPATSRPAPPRPGASLSPPPARGDDAPPCRSCDPTRRARADRPRRSARPRRTGRGAARCARRTGAGSRSS